MKKYILTIFFAGVLLSCKKSAPPSNTCVLNNTTISGIYKTVAITYQASAGDPPADQFTGLPECQKDDTIEMGADGSLLFTDAGMGCGFPPPPGSPTGWTLENGNTVLMFADQEFSIKSFNCKQLVLVERNVFLTGDIKTTTLEKTP